MASSIGHNTRQDLGKTIARHLQNARKSYTAAERDLEDCGLHQSELMLQWKLQKEDQLSIRQRESFDSFLSTLH